MFRVTVTDDLEERQVIDEFYVTEEHAEMAYKDYAEQAIPGTTIVMCQCSPNDAFISKIPVELLDDIFGK